jgi:hypothetical protein
VGNLKAARWTGRDREAMSAYVQRGVIVYRGADGGWKEVTA